MICSSLGTQRTRTPLLSTRSDRHHQRCDRPGGAARATSESSPRARQRSSTTVKGPPRDSHSPARRRPRRTIGTTTSPGQPHTHFQPGTGAPPRGTLARRSSLVRRQRRGTRRRGRRPGLQAARRVAHVLQRRRRARPPPGADLARRAGGGIPHHRHRHGRLRSRSGHRSIRLRGRLRSHRANHREVRTDLRLEHRGRGRPVRCGHPVMPPCGQSPTMPPCGQSPTISVSGRLGVGGEQVWLNLNRCQ